MKYTLLEYMPVHLRAGHLAAGNSGRYPSNGAERVYVEGDVESRLLDPRWAEIVEDEIRELPEGETALADIPEEAFKRAYDDEP